MKRWQKGVGMIVLSVAILIGVGPFLVPLPPLPDPVSPQALAGPESQFVEVDGLRVHTQVGGSGEPVILLLHGFGASTFSWRKVMSPLSEGGTVVAYDRPAFGLTERPLSWAGQNPYAPQAQVQLIFNLTHTLDLEGPLVLVGNSAGGTLAASAALSHPEQVQGLVLVSPAIYTGGGSPGWIRPLLRAPQLDRLGPWIARRLADRGRDFLEKAYHDPSSIAAEDWEGYRRPLRVEGWDRALWEYIRASRPPDLASKVDQVRVPTLVITGDDDRVVPTAESIRLAGEIPGAALVVLEGCGHLPQEECPEGFLDAVLPFLQSVHPRESPP